MARGDTKYFDADARPSDVEMRAFVIKERGGYIRVPAAGGYTSMMSKLHVPDIAREGVICPLSVKETREKPVDVYPTGFAEWCEMCMAITFPGRAKVSMSGDYE